MSSLVKWDPFAEVASLRRAMDRVFDEFMPMRWRAAETVDLTFPIDLWETDDRVMVRAALPGVKPDEIDISVSEGVLTIKGEHKEERKEEKESYYHREIRYGAFSRSVQLPCRVDHERAEAEFENGVLTISLPKAEEVRSKTIKVRSKELVGARS